MDCRSVLATGVAALALTLGASPLHSQNRAPRPPPTAKQVLLYAGMDRGTTEAWNRLVSALARKDIEAALLCMAADSRPTYREALMAIGSDGAIAMQSWSKSALIEQYGEFATYVLTDLSSNKRPLLPSCSSPTSRG